MLHYFCIGFGVCVGFIVLSFLVKLALIVAGLALGLLVNLLVLALYLMIIGFAWVQITKFFKK